MVEQINLTGRLLKLMQEEYDFQIIANLLAGKGEAKVKLEKLKDFLSKNDLSFRSLEITKPTPISQIPQDGRIKIKKGVICLGGDGTVSETVGYVLNNKIEVPIALIPTGTANIIASTLRLIISLDNFNFLLENKIKTIDIGVAEFKNEKDYFILGLGLGFEEKFLKITKEKLKSKLGIFSYILSALSELLSLKKIPLKIENCKSKINLNVCLLTVLNLQPAILKAFPLFKDSRIIGDDGRFNLYYIEYKNYFQAFLGTLLFHFLGRFNFGLVKTLKGNDFLVKSPISVGTQIDGELRSTLPVKISLHSQSCRFLIP